MSALFRPFARATQLLRRQFAITAVPVPNMGDSISEGTVLKFTKGKGEAVAVDEIVAVLETDKVSVDIRSPLAGVMSELCAKQGDTVQVGAQLFKIDSDGKATATSSPAAAAPAAPAPVAAAPTQAAPAKVEAPAVHSHGRVPMIKFKYGKRDASAAAPVVAAAPKSAVAPVLASPSAALGVAPADFLSKIAAYRRKPLSADVIASINSAGASVFDPPPAPAKGAKGGKGKK